jgi:hypothetical protein
LEGIGGAAKAELVDEVRGGITAGKKALALWFGTGAVEEDGAGGAAMVVAWSF